MNRSPFALLLVAAAVFGLPAAASAQDGTGTGTGTGQAPKAETAGKPAADTQDPGKTATEAVTHPSAVPPAEGAVGSGKPPTAEAPPSAGR